MKTNKSISKRLRLTKKGKVLFRPGRQNHFNAKESGNRTRGKKGFKSLPESQARIFRSAL